MDEQLYEIQEGVRRAKAAWLCGREMIEAQINGSLGGTRWERVLRGTRSGAALPPIEVLPIEVLPGARGKTIEEVRVPQDELDLFR